MRNRISKPENQQRKLRNIIENGMKNSIRYLLQKLESMNNGQGEKSYNRLARDRR